MPANRDQCKDCQIDHSSSNPTSTPSATYEWQPDRVAVVVVDETLDTLAQALARTAFRRRGLEGTTPSRSKASVRLLDDLGAFELSHLAGADWRDIDALAKPGTSDAQALLNAVREQDTAQPVVYDPDGNPLENVADVDDGWLVAGVLRHKVRTFENRPTRVLECRKCGTTPHAHRGRERVDARIDDPLLTAPDLWTCKACRRTRTGPKPESKTDSCDREWPDTIEQERAHEDDAIGTEMAEYIETHRRN
ncbi:hypothetical protein [Halorubellus sp. PRR65]|uniref:hypothetical protein n=1 Tax=Halorubellus sp. PRR65 TaxID=3098148 RepID=UPI002B263FD2|nr:hypothetical protein [Halorubellus sp. PRR65]